ncbi:MAG: BRCT domain-containing protein [Lysinibacillus sp.]
MEFIYFEDEQLVHPFLHKKIVFPGTLTTMPRSEAVRCLKPFAVTLQGGVNGETDFVVLGDKRRGISTKQRQAEKLIALGHDIQLLSEDDFLWLLKQ